MTAGWVACSVRARAMCNRRLGRAAARSLAASPSLPEALNSLGRSPYRREINSAQTLAQAQHAVVGTAVWNVRVLAGWAPRDGATMLRMLAGAVEVANVIDRAQWLAGGRDTTAPYQLGRLATAWPRLSHAADPAALRRALVESPWGDPGGESPREVALALRAVLADRVIAAVPPARAWAQRFVALLVARELAGNRELPPAAQAAASRVLGPAAGARSLEQLRAQLPNAAAPALANATGADDLWRSEARWWSDVERDAAAMARGATPGPEVLVGTVALLAVDAWRVRGALEIAGRGGRPLEVFDAVA